MLMFLFREKSSLKIYQVYLGSVYSRPDRKEQLTGGYYTRKDKSKI